MRNNYKKIFDEVIPDKKLVDSVISMTEEKKISFSKTVAVAACFLFVIGGLAAGIYFNSSDDSMPKTEIVDIPVAYETKNKSETVKHIKTKICSGDKTVFIDADVIIEGEAEKMCLYSAEYKQFSVEDFEELLYGEGGFYYAENKRESTIMPILSPRGTGMIFEAESKAVTLDRIIKKQLEEKLVNGKNQVELCELTYSQARNLADDFLQRIEFNDFEFYEGKINPTVFTDGKYVIGSYDIQYYQYADGFSIETVSPNVLNGVASDLNIKIDDDGIVNLRLCGLNLRVKEELNGNIMNVETAIEKAEEALPELWLSEYAPVVEIRLEYMLDELEDGRLELVPCWHFCIDETALKHQSIEIQRANDTNDLCINAVTGEMYRVGNRYPVYQLSDGSIAGTWNNR